jgi:hypothetical protein
LRPNRRAVDRDTRREEKRERRVEKDVVHIFFIFSFFPSIASSSEPYLSNMPRPSLLWALLVALVSCQAAPDKKAAGDAVLVR